MIGTEKFTFTGARGQVLDGRLEKPLYTSPKAAALFAHCFTCTKQSVAATRISSALARRGIAVLRFDFTGLGGSDGDFANAGFATNVDDLVAAAEALEAADLVPELLVGHSLGGAAVIAAAERIAPAKAVVTLNAPFDTTHVFEQFGDAALSKIENEGEGDVELAGRTFRIARDFLEQERDQPQAQRLAAMRQALLVLHAPRDETVSIENARAIFEAAKHPKSYVALDGADHLLTDRADAEYAADVIAAWASRYFSPPEEEVRALSGTVAVLTAGGKFAQHVRTATHHFIADEPVSYGGNDDGPTPYDLLLAALGACTSMTIKMYADRKQIPLERVRIELEHSRDHHEDCVDCESDGRRIEVLDRAIELVGDLTDEQRARLMEIADRCPVHRTLESDLHIHSSEVR